MSEVHSSESSFSFLNLPLELKDYLVAFFSVLYTSIGHGYALIYLVSK